MPRSTKHRSLKKSKCTSPGYHWRKKVGCVRSPKHSKSKSKKKSKRKSKGRTKKLDSYPTIKDALTTDEYGVPSWKEPYCKGRPAKWCKDAWPYCSYGKSKGCAANSAFSRGLYSDSRIPESQRLTYNQLDQILRDMGELAPTESLWTDKSFTGTTSTSFTPITFEPGFELD